MQAKVKAQTEKELWLQILVNTECTYMGIDKQLVKKEQIKTKPADKTKNREVK